MADRNSVNDQITDAVSQTNVTNVAGAPAQALASLYQILSSSLSLAVHNAVSNQQQLQQISLASTSSCIAYLLDKDTEQVVKNDSSKSKPKEEKRSTKN